MNVHSAAAPSARAHQLIGCVRASSYRSAAEKERRVRVPATLARMRRRDVPPGTLMRPVVRRQRISSLVFLYIVLLLPPERLRYTECTWIFRARVSYVNEIIPAGS